ncbi:ATP-binding protein [Olsenella sp. Marseille-P4559]|uniref:ATP-binding protein n=1 Tax=Olsenella sp. Marseille-P4559 TaxID=2364795 RepID=UPI00103266B5|nr:ATP-binding protein [Olsenella sp. Marseille-P4559]
MSTTIAAIMTRSALILTATISTQLVIAVGMFAALLPKRSLFALRGVASCVAMAFVSFALYRNSLVVSVFSSRTVSFVAEALDFVAMLALIVGTLVLCFEVSIWTALFCATAGYIIQNLASCVTYSAFLLAEGTGTNMASPLFLPLNLLGMAVVYPVCYWFFVRPIHKNGLVEIENKKILLVLALVVLIAIVFDMENKYLLIAGIPVPLVMVLRAVHDVICVFALALEFEMLYSRQLESDMAALKRMDADQEAHYTLMRESVEAVNARVEALRCRVRAAAREGGANAAKLEELAGEARMPELRLKTGNDALDALLLVKGLVCEREGATLSCIADGSALSFMDPVDIYSLVGNALDNSLDAIRKLPDPNRRAIGLVARRTGGMLTLNVTNYFDGNVTMVDGLPKTTAADPTGHGLGSRSMRDVAEKYGGSVTFSHDDDVFHVNVLIPIPE